MDDLLLIEDWERSMKPGSGEPGGTGVVGRARRPALVGRGFSPGGPSEPAPLYGFVIINPLTRASVLWAKRMP